MKQEPVAWLKNGNTEWVQYPTDMSNPIPLYTTPQLKELSIKEQEMILLNMFGEMSLNTKGMFLDFADAILKKASEK